MEEKYKKFLEYNWRDSAEWQLYYSNLSEVPPVNKIEHFKKRFYKLKVDPDFDVKWVPSDNTNTNFNNQRSQQGTRQNTSNTQNTSNATAIRSSMLASVEALLWAIFFILTLFMSSYTLIFTSITLVVRIIRRLGLPKFSMDYAQVLFLDEHFQLMLYSLLLMIDRFNFFTLVPLGITAVMNISEFCKTKPNIFASLLPYTNQIYNKRVDISIMRANSLVAIGFLLILGILLRVNSLLIPIFYWQFLRFLYIVNHDIKHSFSKLNMMVNNFKNKPFIPGVVKLLLTKVQEFATYMGRTEAGPGQAAGGANCLIF